MSTPASDSPCILVCVIDRSSGYCFGCGRTGQEIARWMLMSGEERRGLLDQLPPRLAAMERPPAGFPPPRRAARQEGEA
ncbi:MAG TPA: DUF1289 domain-containing protein [Rhizobiaceae bacterium]|nr:DUF1289 domain-containing protein [Rhizobiaceae bacterium]